MAGYQKLLKGAPSMRRKRQAEFDLLLGPVSFAQGGPVDEDAILREAYARRRRMYGRSSPTDTPTSIPRGIFDSAAGLLRGSTAATLGLPGDLEGLGRGALGLVTGGLDGAVEGLGERTVLPTTERMSEWLPSAGDSRAAQVGQSVGEWLPLPVPWRAGVRALRNKLGRKAAAKEALQDVDELIKQELTPAFAEGGLVSEDDLEELIDQAYMNIKFDEEEASSHAS